MFAPIVRDCAQVHQVAQHPHFGVHWTLQNAFVALKYGLPDAQWKTITEAMLEIALSDGITLPRQVGFLGRSPLTSNTPARRPGGSFAAIASPLLAGY